MIDLLKSRLLEACGVEHGFNLRGRGAGAYGAANLGRSVGDDPGRVEANHRDFARAVGFAPGRLFEASQVHGRAVLDVQPGDDPLATRACEADALVTAVAGVAIGVRVADCVPVLLCEPSSGAVAAIHAGWRGVVAGVVEAGLEQLLRTSGSGADGVVAAIFPHIGRCCFEVGQDVAQALLDVSPNAAVIDETRDRPHADLHGVVRGKLIARGVAAARIDSVPGCTRCEAQSFFSFRRDGARSGRHVAAIVARARP